jgi:hypothetical protein
VAVIVTDGPQSTQAAREATGTIPIVMARMDDADAQGFVTNYSRPGGNITGLSFQTGELSTKWLQLLKETLPRDSRIAALWDATGTGNQLRTIEQAARSVKVDLYTVEWRSLEEFEVAFTAAQNAGAKGVVILASPVFSAQLTRFCRPRHEPSDRGYLYLSRVCRGWRLNQLWAVGKRSEFQPSARSLFCGQAAEGRQGGRAPGRAADKILSRHQSQDREGAGSRRAAVAARYRRRGHRVASILAAPAQVSYWHLSDLARCPT